MKAGLIFPVTSTYQAEAYDNLNRCPTAAQRFLVQPESLSIHREREVWLLSVCLCVTVADHWTDVYKLCMNLLFLKCEKFFCLAHKIYNCT